MHNETDKIIEESKAAEEETKGKTAEAESKSTLSETDEKTAEKPDSDQEESQGEQEEIKEELKDEEEQKTEEEQKPDQEQRIKELEASLAEYKDSYQRLLAEFSNYKKREQKEREGLYLKITAATVSKFLPVIDNLERAVSAANSGADLKSMAEGLNMILSQVKDVLSSLSVEEISSVGEQFNPDVHEAVMRVEDENCQPNTIVEELQKGYKLKDIVIRPSMVKVSN